ncbi:MAG: Rid family detoxifying hydrolase [Chloroflexota bacterium]
MSTDPQVIVTPNAPSAIGPYSQGQRVGDFIFTAGQIAIDPKTPGQLVAGGITAQTAQALQNVAAILTAAGSSLARVVKTTVFMADLAEFAAMNAVYAQSFAQRPPARSTVQVAALPLGASVMIEAIAVANAT